MNEVSKVPSSESELPSQSMVANTPSNSLNCELSGLATKGCEPTKLSYRTLLIDPQFGKKVPLGQRFQILVPFYVGESASPGKSDYFRRSSVKHNQSKQEGLLQ